MAKFRYVGQPLKDGGRDVCKSSVVSYDGISFPAGEPIEVADASLASRLRGSDHFEEVKSKQAKAGE
jgi:hypothetical protein